MFRGGDLRRRPPGNMTHLHLLWVERLTRGAAPLPVHHRLLQLADHLRGLPGLLSDLRQGRFHCELPTEDGRLQRILLPLLLGARKSHEGP